MNFPPRKPYPTDVSDEEWAFVAPYLSLMTEEALRRRHDLREVFNALRWMVRAGAPWRYLPGTAGRGWYVPSGAPDCPADTSKRAKVELSL